MYDPKNIDPKFIEEACDQLHVDYESYVEGTNEEVDALAQELAQDSWIMQNEARYEGER